MIQEVLHNDCFGQKAQFSLILLALLRSDRFIGRAQLADERLHVGGRKPGFVHG